MTFQPRRLQRIDGLAPAGLPTSDMTATDIEVLWPALKGLGALWVSARMNLKQKSPLHMYCGKGQDSFGGPLNGIARAPNGGVTRTYRLGRPALAHGSFANNHLEVEYDIPQSYMMYAVWSVVGTGGAGMIGVGDPVGLRFYSASTSLGFRHSSAANGDVVAGSNVQTAGALNVGWACYDHAATTAYLAGMSGSVARLNHAITEVWGVPPPSGKSLRIGSADGVAQAQFIYDAIIVPEALYVTDNARHDTIVTALAANAGLTAA